MNIKQNQQHKAKPPVLLRGLFVLVSATIAIILSSAWLIIDYKFEQLISNRTSEYAHSIAKIAANSSSDSLIAEDKLALEMLVENVAKDPYINSATIFSQDGQVFAKFPKFNQTSLASSLNHENEVYVAGVQQKNPSQNNLKAQQKIANSQSKKSQPYVEPIIFQGVTNGWFKVVLNREALESQFRRSLANSRHLILLVSLFMLCLLAIVLMRFIRNTSRLAKYCQRLMQINLTELPKNNHDWMEAMRQLSETQFYQLAETKTPAISDVEWSSSKRTQTTIFCYCQFTMQEQEDEQTAYCLTQAEIYLQSAIKAHGGHSQGNVLSGCLIPFFAADLNSSVLTEAISLVQLIKQLLASLPLPIQMRAFIGAGSILVLENSRGETTGLSLSNRLAEKINKISSIVPKESVVCTNFEIEQLETLGQFSSIKNIPEIEAYILDKVSPNIQQLINRQIKYIKQN